MQPVAGHGAAGSVRRVHVWCLNYGNLSLLENTVLPTNGGPCGRRPAGLCRAVGGDPIERPPFQLPSAQGHVHSDPEASHHPILPCFARAGGQERQHQIRLVPLLLFSGATARTQGREEARPGRSSSLSANLLLCPAHNPFRGCSRLFFFQELCEASLMPLHLLQGRWWTGLLRNPSVSTSTCVPTRPCRSAVDWTRPSQTRFLCLASRFTSLPVSTSCSKLAGDEPPMPLPRAAGRQWIHCRRPGDVLLCAVSPVLPVHQVRHIP